MRFRHKIRHEPGWFGSYRSRHERRLQELGDAADAAGEQATGITTAQAFAIGEAMLVGLQIHKYLNSGLVTPEVFERAFALLADLLPGAAQKEPRTERARPLPAEGLAIGPPGGILRS